MDKLIKLTDAQGQTGYNTQWGAGVTHTLPACDNPQLCSSDVLHAYRTLNQALLLYSLHDLSPGFRVWEAAGDVVGEDATKVGVFELTTTREIELPAWFTDNDARKWVCVQFAVLCANAVLPIYEAQWPGVHRPHVAIRDAQVWLANPSAAATEYTAKVYAGEVHALLGRAVLVCTAAEHAVAAVISNFSFTEYAASAALAAADDANIDLVAMADKAVRRWEAKA